jgi:hypothetical protein
MLPGYSTQVELMPKEGVGVVVFVNSTEDDSGATVDSSNASTSKVAEARLIAKNIINALYYTMKGP